MNCLQLFLEYAPYTQTTGDDGPFDTTQFGYILNADIGHPLTASGEPVQTAYAERMLEEVLHADAPPLRTSTAFQERYCVTSDDGISDRVILESGDEVSVGDYDVVLISNIWFQHYYVGYLSREHPEVTLIGIQEESPQDVMSFSPTLQAYHRDALSAFDGYVAFTDQFRRWIAPFVEEAIHLPLPMPRGHFDGVARSRESRSGVVIGVGTWNLDFSNFYSGLLVHDALTERGFDLDAEIVGVRDWQRKLVGDLRDVTVTGFLDEDYYEYLSSFRLAVLLTTRVTAGRTSAEFAGVGVPCIGNGRNDLQARCWPDLSVEPFDVAEAVSLAERLLTDERFYERTVDRAADAVADLQSRDWFRDEIGSFVERVHRI